jgi:hypothetical protein
MLWETAPSFFSVERAVDLPSHIDRAYFRKLECEMLGLVEEDRTIVSALLSPQVPSFFLSAW